MPYMCMNNAQIIQCFYGSLCLKADTFHPGQLESLSLERALNRIHTNLTLRLTMRLAPVDRTPYCKVQSELSSHNSLGLASWRPPLR